MSIREERRKRRYQRMLINRIFLSIFIVLFGFVCFFIGRSSVHKVAGKAEKKLEKPVVEVDNSITSESSSQEVDKENTIPNENPNNVQDTEQPPINKAEQQIIQDYHLIISERPFTYYYDNVLSDLKILEKKYPELIEISSTGKTLDERSIWILRIGAADASHKVLIHAGIHAREYITCQMLMEITCNFLEKYKLDATYKNYSITELMKDTAIYVIPMVNPDGMSISQLGMEGVQTDRAKERIQEIARRDGNSLSNSYLSKWKANANGVDLNRNFDAKWEEYAGSGHISSDHYKGDYIGSEPESAALIELTKSEMFERTISYHTQGQVVYWYFGQAEPLYTATYNFAKRMGNMTGYPLDANYQKLDPAGYKDWCVYRMDIPSITIEVGKDTSPVPSSQYDQIYRQNEYVFEETLIDLIENPYRPSGKNQTGNNSYSNNNDMSKASNGLMLKVVKCNEYISLREKPSSAAEVLDKINLGEQVKFIAKAANGYYQVEYHGQIGYAMADYLE